MVRSFCLLMLIMLIIRSFVCQQRALIGQWPECPSSTIVLAAVSSRSAAGSPGPRVSEMPPPGEKLFTSCEIYASDGGLLVAPINAPHLPRNCSPEAVRLSYWPLPHTYPIPIAQIMLHRFSQITYLTEWRTFPTSDVFPQTVPSQTISLLTRTFPSRC